MVPTVSVIIATYNRAANLTRSLDSILGQRFRDFEIIVADDGSDDDTALVLDRYGNALRVIRQEHRGVAAARNAGLAVAAGEYVAFHDSDDLALADRLTVQHNYLAPREHLGAVICNGWLGTDSSPWVQDRLGRRLETDQVSLADVFEHSLALTQAMLFRRAAIGAANGFDESLPLLSDLDFVLRFALRWPIGFLNVPVFTYLKQADSLTADRLAIREHSLSVLERLIAEHPEMTTRLGHRTIRRKRAHRYYSLAKHRRGRRNIQGALAAVDRAVALAPLSLQYRLLRWRLALDRVRSTAVPD